MERQLQHGYTTQGIIHAYNICRFPEDYTPKLQLMALRYFYMYRKRGDRRISESSPEELATKMFTIFMRKKDRESMYEIADIFGQYRAENTNIFLQTAQEYDAQEQKRNNIQKPAIISSVYSDSQNVHNTRINQSVNKAVLFLWKKYRKEMLHGTLQEKEEYKNLCVDNIRNFLQKKFQKNTREINHSCNYIKNSIAVFGTEPNTVTLKEAFISVWLWLASHTHREELEKRMVEELTEMNGKCTTGHLARLANIVQGFSEDEELFIRISDKDQCNSVVRGYLTGELSKCQDEKVLDGILDGTQEFRDFILEKISVKLLSWKQEYGEEILDYVAEIVNEFSGVKIFG